MMLAVNQTHRPDLTSWVASANEPQTDFPIQNLPLGVFQRPGDDHSPRVGVAIGDQIVDMAACLDAGLFDGPALVAAEACAAPTLNHLMSTDQATQSALREQLSNLLRQDDQRSVGNQPLVARFLVPMTEATLLLPVAVGDYSDFYASLEHATNVGSMFRPDNPLLPNYKYVPIGYHGRASSIVASGTSIQRPHGQTRDQPAMEPTYGPCKALDYEVEVGIFVGAGNMLGEPVPIATATEHIFGLCLLNDWSARDIQSWEYQPLGPFLAKSFATTLSPWVVTLEALAPFRGPVAQRPLGDPRPLDYLTSPADQQLGAIDLTLEVFLASHRMREAGQPSLRLSRSNFKKLYWTMAQMLTHHTSNGCNIRPGDLLGSGTVSGAAKDERGCLLELTWRGAEPLTLPDGELRRFLEDGDEIVMHGYCERPGTRRIGFGECRGIIRGGRSVGYNC
ncbi:MAG: fumarylacetoacetase [Herpetosiphonaceae bacterium]|nr:fumarylacetoacetase [Herpetosiphonaceae bacterium]